MINQVNQQGIIIANDMINTIHNTTNCLNSFLNNFNINNELQNRLAMINAIENIKQLQNNLIALNENCLLETVLTKKRKDYSRKFSALEDFLLTNIVNTFGPKNWNLIASLMPNKTSRQCRDRYKNYLAPGYIYSNWTEEEDIILAKKYKEFGPKWSKIQKFLPNRTSNSIKNRFNYSVGKKNKIQNEIKKSNSMTTKKEKMHERLKIKIDNNPNKIGKPIDQPSKILSDNENCFEKQIISDIFFNDIAIIEDDFNSFYF